MSTCPRCRSNYPGSGKVCPACTGKPHSSSELRALAAGPTVPAPVGLPAPAVARARRPPPSVTVDLAPATTVRQDKDPTADPLIGQMPLGQYKILKKIGEGGFGAVYVADQMGVNRKAVIKVLRKDLAGSGAFVRRFQREASILAALDHHHLIRLFNFGELPDGQLFLAMEYGGDRTLAEEITLIGRLDFDRALRITEQVCSALQEAHVRGVIHRDLKPANIMLGQRAGHDWVKVVDVGIAKILDTADVDDGQSQLTAAGMIIGTPAYFSPEQARSLPLDGRSDVYAMGCVLYEMISGKLPIVAQTPVDFVRAHCMDAPVPLRKRGIGAPPALESLIARTLAKSPADRPTAGELMALVAATRSRIARKAASARKQRTVRVSAAACVLVLCLAAVWWRWQIGAAPAPLPVPEAPARPAARPAIAVESPPPQPRPEPLAAAVPPPAPPAADPAEQKSAKWSRRAAHIDDLVKAGKLQQAIGESERALGEGPPRAIKGMLYKALGNASHDNGDSEAAYRYFQLYREYCPAGELAALNEKLRQLRVDLGLPPAH
jgi:tRNA A-37 threonylcarbamoyl transferase component Bud32